MELKFLLIDIGVNHTRENRNYPMLPGRVKTPPTRRNYQSEF